MSFDVGPDTLPPPFVMNPSLPPPARDPTASIDALRSDANPMTPAAPTPNAFSVLEPSSSILLPSRPGSEPSESDAANGPSLLDVDPQIIEALKSKDRLYVLKLGEQMECFINDHRTRLDLTPTTSYQRLLVHRCSAYYKLAPETDPINKTISVALTIESRIPTRRIADLVPAPPSHAQPAFKIMQRTATDRPRSKPQSHAGSVIGEEAESSDVEPSEAGSVGGRSNTAGSGKKHMTIAEREAAYNEARSRIFMDFQEKEKVKEKDLSASSSSASLTSGSVTSSVGETSSTGDLEDSISSPATESEWSGPAVRDRKDGRRSNGSSSRSMRSSAPTYGSNSSRESRPPSPPSFRYPSLYAPSLAAAPYDQSHHPMHPSAYNNSYMYAYPQPAPPQGCLPYYAPCPYPPPQAPIPTGDPALPSTQADAFGIQQHNNVFIPCGWNYPQQPHPLPHPPAQQQPHQAPGTPIAPPATQYPPYPPVPAYASYSMPVYYTSPPPLPHFSSSPVPQNLPLGPPEYNGAHDTFSPGRPYPGVPGQQSPTMSNKARGAPPARSAWSYGPGVGMGGFGVNNVNGRSVSSSGKDAVGPRLNPSTRRPGNGRSGGFNGTPAGDEAASTASSSTSSSSRRTFNTSTSSQHPLPARPDWAVGLKAQPTLHPTHNRHHDHTVNARTSPVRNNGQRGQPAPPVLQATDFPPLNPVSQTEKRMPPVAGVWNNSSSTRSILMPGNNGLQGSALVNHSANGRVATGNTPACRLEDYDGNWKPGITSSKSPVPQQDKERMRGDAVSSATLAERVMVLSIDDKDGAKPLTPVTLAV